jgi:hypothetical protein
MIELIQGEGGVLPLESEYIKAVEQAFKQRDILLTTTRCKPVLAEPEACTALCRRASSRILSHQPRALAPGFP